MNIPDWKVVLWNAVNRYAQTCGGDPSKNVYGNTSRQLAVVDVERAIDAAVAEAVALEARMRKRAIDEAVAAERESRSAIDEATNEIVELAASYSKTIPGMRDALQRLWDIDDASSTVKS